MKIPVHPKHKVVIMKRNGRKNMVPYAWCNVHPNVLQTTTRGGGMREHSKLKASKATSRRSNTLTVVLLIVVSLPFRGCTTTSTSTIKWLSCQHPQNGHFIVLFLQTRTRITFMDQQQQKMPLTRLPFCFCMLSCPDAVLLYDHPYC